MRVEHCIGCTDDDCLPCIREERTKLRDENERLTQRLAELEAAGREMREAQDYFTDVEASGTSEEKAVFARKRIVEAEDRFDALLDETEERKHHIADASKMVSGDTE